ncbi:Fc receptor-like protein 5 [Leuresthes tenuis]|uniref:Fc receptor-like protein 5 n=1 Tax=Leuresthes tenuis TaxID=355514 RepID=UPI003B50E4EC
MSDAVIIYQTVPNKPTVTLQPSWAQIYRGETVSLRCWIQGGDYRWWEYEWTPTNTNAPTSREYRIIAESNSREYRCRGRSGFLLTGWSEGFTLKVSSSKPRATLTAPRTTIPAGGSVALSCSVDGSDGWRFDWFRDGSDYSAAQPRGNNEAITVSQGGLYHCRGGRGGGPTVILQPSWAQIYRGETVTARCEIQGGGGTQWEYEWRPARLNIPPTSSEHRVTDSGEYSCRGRKDQFNFTQWSDVITVTVSSEPRPVLTVSPSWLSPGASVTLSCQVEHLSAGWRFYWYKAVPDRSKKSYSYELLPESNNRTEHDSYIIHGQTHTAGYVCRAGRGDPEYYTDYSDSEFVWSADLHPAASLTVSPDRVQHFRDDPVSLNCEGNSAEWRVTRITETGLLSYCSESYWGTMTGSSCNIKHLWTGNAVFWCESGSGEFSNAVNITGQISIKPTVILQPSWAQIFRGETVSLRCEIQGGDDREWEYEWTPTNTNAPTSREYRIITESNSREYRCMGRSGFLFTGWSEGFTLEVSSSKPRATLTAPRTTIPAGGSVALSCSVDGSDGWRFDWFRDGSAYSAAQPRGNNEAITVSQGGLYHCRGGRGGGRGGEPGFYTEVSRKVPIEETLSIKATVILQPSWAQIYRGETVTARCEIQGGGGIQWEYEWRPASAQVTMLEHEWLGRPFVLFHVMLKPYGKLRGTAQGITPPPIRKL